MNTERYVMEVEENLFVRWIAWTGGFSPVISKGSFDEAMIVSEQWLKYNFDRIDRTREDLLITEYPHIQFKKVKVSL